MDVQCLCAEVAKYEVLYNPINVNFKNPQSKEAAWRSVGQTMGADWFVCRDKFKKLRDAFVRSMRKRKLDGSGSRYKFETELEFLVPYIKHRVNEAFPFGESTTYDDSDQSMTSNSPVPSKHYSCGDQVDHDAGDQANSDRVGSVPPQFVGALNLVSRRRGHSPDRHDATSPVPNNFSTKNGPPFADNPATPPPILPTTINPMTTVNHQPRVDIKRENGKIMTFESPFINPAVNTDNDDSAIFGRLVASSLRKMNRRSQIIARKRIFELLIEGEADNYNRSVISFKRPANGLREGSL